MVDARGGDIFLLLPRVLLEEGASVDGRRAVGLDLLAVGRLLERVQVEGGGELSKTMLPMGGRLFSKGTMSEQASEESLPFLADLDLAELFLPSTEILSPLLSSPNPWDSHWHARTTFYPS